MASNNEKSVLRKKLEFYEGLVDHMYLDTKGFLTVGIGHLLPSVASAQQVDFFRRKDNIKATHNEIKTDYETVGKQRKGMLAGNYKRHAKVFLKRAAIDALTNKHIESFEKELKLVYKAFGSFPTEVRLALFDMIFNLGMTKLKA